LQATPTFSNKAKIMADETTATATPAPPANPANVPYTDPAPAGGNGAAPPPPPPQPTAATTTAAIPEQPTASASPSVLLPAKRGGLAGVLDEVRNWIAGTNSNQVYIDPNSGDRYVQHPLMSHKQQWLKVGGEALTGAAAGLAAGKGAGNSGRALLAGFQMQHGLSEEASARDEEQAQQQYLRARQTRLDKANSQLVQMQLAEGALRMDREQRLASQDQVKWSQYMNGLYESQQAQDLGTYNSNDIHEIEKAHPDVWKAHFGDNTIKPVPQFDADGKPAGVKFYLTHPSLDSQPIGPGTKLHTFVPSDDARTPGHMITKDLDPGSMTQGAYTTAEATQYKRLSDDVDRTQKLSDQETTRQLNQEKIRNMPLERAKLVAETSKEQAQAREANARASFATVTGGMSPEQAVQEQPVNGVRQQYLQSLPADIRGLVQAIGEGRKTDISAYALSRPNSPGAQIAKAVTLAYPGYDFTRATAYQKTRAAFTSGKQAQGINALNAAMNHLQVMYDNADWTTTTPGISNVLRTFGNRRAVAERDAKTALIGELAKAYQAGSVLKDDKEDWTKRINAWSPAETRENAREFIKLLNGKIEASMNEWKNGSPPGAIAPIQFLGKPAYDAYVHITGEQPPQGAQVQTGTSTGNTQPPQQQQSTARIKLANGNVGIVQNGQWVDTGVKAQ
jgi:hypothetical protein